MSAYNHYFKSFANGHITCGCGHLEIHDRSDADVMAAQTRMNDHIRSYYTDAEWVLIVQKHPPTPNSAIAEIATTMRTTIELARQIHSGMRGELGYDRAEDATTIVSFAGTIVELAELMRSVHGDRVMSHEPRTARGIERAHRAVANLHLTWMRDLEKHAIRKYYLGQKSPTEPNGWYCELRPLMTNVEDESTGNTESEISIRIAIRLFEPTQSREARLDELSPEAIEKFAEIKRFVDAWVDGELAELPSSTCGEKTPIPAP